MIFEMILFTAKLMILTSIALTMLFHLLFDTMAGYSRYYYARSMDFAGPGHALTDANKAARFFSPVIKSRKIIPYSKSGLYVYGSLPGIIKKSETLR